MAIEYVCHELALTEHLNRLRLSYPALNLYGLLDGTADTVGLEQFFLLAPEAAYEPLFLDTEFAACLPRSPYLFTITPANEDFLLQWGCWAEHGILWWLSSWPLERQAHHWRSLIHVLSPDRDTTIFRFWDSQVLAPYVLQCTAEERQALLAPCHTFIASHRSREWWIWQNPSQDILPTPQESPWWQVQAHHLSGFQAAFQRLQVDEIEDRLWRLEPAALSRIYPPYLPVLIQQGIQQAHTLGLRQEEALYTFVRCQIRFGPQYWQDTSLTPLWQQAEHRDQSFLAWSHQALTAPPDDGRPNVASITTLL